MDTEAQTRIGRNLLLGNAAQISEVEVALPGASEFTQIVASLFGHRPISGQGEGCVLYYRAACMAEAGVHRQAVQAYIDIAHALHYSASQAYIFSPGDDFRVIHVITVITGIAVVLHDEACLAVLQQKFDPLVLVFGFTESTELKNPPGLGSISGGVPSAVIGGFAGLSVHSIAMAFGNIVLSIEAFQFYSGASGEAFWGAFYSHSGRIYPSNLYSCYILFTHITISLLLNYCLLR